MCVVIYWSKITLRSPFLLVIRRVELLFVFKPRQSDGQTSMDWEFRQSPCLDLRMIRARSLSLLKRKLQVPLQRKRLAGQSVMS
jgi:hypothetical protein